MSVTYLSDNYHELDEEDKTCIERCSPPCLEPAVLERLQQKKLAMTPTDARVLAMGIPQRQLSSETFGKADTCPLKVVRFLSHCCRPKVAILPRSPLPHCNKFYPFTRGQLKLHDINTYLSINELWREIELWDDPFDHRLCRRGFTQCFPFRRQSKFQSDLPS